MVFLCLRVNLILSAIPRAAAATLQNKKRSGRLRQGAEAFGAHSDVFLRQLRIYGAGALEVAAPGCWDSQWKSDPNRTAAKWVRICRDQAAGETLEDLRHVAKAVALARLTAHHFVMDRRELINVSVEKDRMKKLHTLFGGVGFVVDVNDPLSREGFL